MTLRDIPWSHAMDRSDTSRQYDLNGYMMVTDNPISRVGVYPYLGKNIKGAPDPNAVYMVYRSAAELSDPECLASFALMPWIDDHVMLGEGSGLVAPEAKGVHGVIGERVWFDDADLTMKGNIKLWSVSQQQKIDDEEKVELSLGYRCKYIHAPGEFNGVRYDYVQCQIRGNHIASVDDGRLGPDVAVMDGFSLSVEVKEFEKMAKLKAGAGVQIAKASALMKRLQNRFATAMDADDTASPEVAESEIAVLVDQLEAVMPVLEKIEEIKTLPAATADTSTALDEDDEAEKKKKEAETAKVKEKDAAMDGNDIAAIVRREVAKATTALRAELAGTGMDEATVTRTMARKAALAERLSHFVGVFDHSEMTLAQTAKYGVEKLGIPGVAAGSEESALAAYLHGRNAPTQRGRVVEGHGMDGKDAGGEDFLAGYLTNKKEA